MCHVARGTTSARPPFKPGDGQESRQTVKIGQCKLLHQEIKRTLCVSLVELLGISIYLSLVMFDFGRHSGDLCT